MVDYDVLVKITLEFKQSGHEVYVQDMFDAHLSRIPSDYTVLNNLQNLDNAAAAVPILIRN